MAPKKAGSAHHFPSYRSRRASAENERQRMKNNPFPQQLSAVPFPQRQPRPGVLRIKREWKFSWKKKRENMSSAKNKDVT